MKSVYDEVTEITLVVKLVLIIQETDFLWLCAQWEIAEVPNDSPKRTNRGKRHDLKAASPQKISEQHGTSSGRSPSVSSRKGTISTTVYTFRITSAGIYLFHCTVYRVTIGP